MTIRSVPFDPETGELVWTDLERAVTARTGLVAIGAASNALGTVSPELREAAPAGPRPGSAFCFVWMQSHFAAHQVIDVKAMECDFLVCSPYKFYGSHAGVLDGRADVMAALDVPKLDPAPNRDPSTASRPEPRITRASSAAARPLNSSLPCPGAPPAGSGSSPRCPVFTPAAVPSSPGPGNGLGAIPGVRCYGPPPGRPRTPTVSFVVAGVPSKQVAQSLATKGRSASNGTFGRHRRCRASRTHPRRPGPRRLRLLHHRNRNRPPVGSSSAGQKPETRTQWTSTPFMATLLCDMEGFSGDRNDGGDDNSS